MATTGDFLTLLAERQPPRGHWPAASPQAPAALEATTVFAFHTAEGVLAAGDHRATAGNVIFTDNAEKILEIDNHSLMAIAGSPAVALEMARTLRTAFEFYRRSQLQTMSLAGRVRALSRLLRDNIPGALQGIGLVSPIFIGWDTPRRPGDGPGRGTIHFYDPLGAHFEAVRQAASGSGSGSIRSVLHHLAQWGRPKPEEMNLPEAVRLALRLLATAAQFDSATGGVDPERGVFATLKLLTAQGVRTITDEEQARMWSAKD